MNDAVNFLILTAKAFIWREKRWGKPCAMIGAGRRIIGQIINKI